MRLMLVLFACLAVPGGAPSEQALIRAGWIEEVFFPQLNFRVLAKLDTGATTSSIGGLDAEYFQRDGKKWVRFYVRTPDGGKIEVQRPLVRMTTIRRAGVDAAERPVVEMLACVAGVLRAVEFNLADRSEMNHQVLIGRSFLDGRILVDSGVEQIQTGKCD